MMRYTRQGTLDRVNENGLRNSLKINSLEQRSNFGNAHHINAEIYLENSHTQFQVTRRRYSCNKQYKETNHGVLTIPHQYSETSTHHF